MSGAGSAQDRAQAAAPPRRSPAEWVTFAIAAAIVLAIAGLVLGEWLSSPVEPPILSVRQEGDPRREDGRFYVPFVVENAGNEAVEIVQVIGELWVDEVVEDGEQNIDFLSGGETAEGAFVFTRDPAEGRLVLRIASYKLP